MKTYITPKRPDPCIRTEIIERVDLRYQEMMSNKRGGISFVAANEAGMGRHATLQALFAHFQNNYHQSYLLGGTIEGEQFKPWQQLPKNSTTLGLAHQLLGISGDAGKKDLLGNVLALADATGKIALPLLGFVAQLLQTVSSAQALTHELIAKEQLGEVRPDPTDLRKLLRRAAIDRPVVCIFDRFDHFDPGWWSAFFMGFAGELQHTRILFVVSLTGDAAPPTLDAEKREGYKTLPLIATWLQRQGWAEWHYLSHYTPEQVKNWIGLADKSLPDRLYSATAGHPRHMAELWKDWERHGLLFANLDDLIWRLKWQPNDSQLGEVGELLDERFASLFPELDDLQRQDLQRELAIAALEGKSTTAQVAAQILGEDIDDWIDLLDDTLIFSDENPDGIFEESEAVAIQDSAGAQLRNLWRYRFVSDLHRRALVALRLNDEQCKTASLALAESLIDAYAPQFALIAQNLVELFTRVGEGAKAITYHQYTQRPDSPLLAKATRHALTHLPWQAYDQWQQLVYAWLLLQQGKKTLLRIPYAESEAIFGQVVEIARLCNDREYLAEGLRYQGWMVCDGGRPHQALPLFAEALQLYRELGDKGGEAQTLNHIGSVYSALGDKRQALAYCEQALPLTRQVSDKGGEAQTLNNIGSAYAALGDKQKALAYIEQALPLTRQVGDKGGEAKTLTGLGSVYSALGDKRQALAYYAQALPLMRQVGDKGGEASTLHAFGSVYSDLGDKRQALAYYEQALPLMRQVGDKGGEASTLYAFGSVYSALGDKQQALAYYEQALPLMRQVGDKGGEAKTLTGLAGYFADLGDHKLAARHYQQALDLARQVGDPSGEISALNSLGGLYTTLGEHEKAMQQFDQIIPLLEKAEGSQSEAVMLHGIGVIYANTGQADKSIEFLERALAISVGKIEHGYERVMHINTATVYEKQGRLQQAIAQQEQAIALDEAVHHPDLEKDRAELARLREKLQQTQPGAD